LTLDEVDESSRTASAGKVNKPLIPKNNILRFNRLYVFDVYNLFALFDIELDNILHTPDDRKRYPNDPAVNFGIKFCIFGCIDVEDSTLDDDVDNDEMVSILTSSNNPDNILVMVASLYPDDRYFGGDGNATSTSLLFVSSISLLLVLSVSSTGKPESEASSLLSVANKENREPS